MVEGKEPGQRAEKEDPQGLERQWGPQRCGDSKETEGGTFLTLALERRKKLRVSSDTSIGGGVGMPASSLLKKEVQVQNI